MVSATKKSKINPPSARHINTFPKLIVHYKKNFLILCRKVGDVYAWKISGK